jgi:hypothetical protein
MFASLAPLAGPLSGKPHYLHWGVVQISLTNFLIVVAMIVIFVLALLLPFPGGKAGRDRGRADGKH